jgi:large subunit ribosomal protein L10
VERAQKKELVSSLNEIFTSTGVVVVSHYNGLTVAEMTDLRNKMREAGASLKVTKNRLTRLALEGTDVESITNLFTGPTVIGYSDDPVAAPKILNAFAKDNEKLQILGGAMGTTELDVAGVKNLASLPSLDALRGKLIGCISAPAQKTAAVLQAPAGQLARVFGVYGATDAA